MDCFGFVTRVTDPKARLTETEHGELRSKVEQVYYNLADSPDLTQTTRRHQLPGFPGRRLQPVGDDRAGKASPLIG